MTATESNAAGVSAGEGRLYEAMFLISQAAAADLNEVVEHIDNLMQRANASLVALSKWDERRLAYEIDKQKRGIYLLAYFTAGSEGVSSLEHDVNLSETIMRVLVVRVDHMSLEQAQAADDREGLATEAKMRAERGADRDEGRKSGARLGAPEPAAPAEAPAGEGDAPEAEAPAEAPADAPAEADGGAEQPADG